MRNKNFELSGVERKAAAAAHSVLDSLSEGDHVEVSYTKRDGTPATLSGGIVNIVGKDSTEALVVSTAKGYRSANLWAIEKIGR